MEPTRHQPGDQELLIGPENALAHASAVALARGEVRGLSPLIWHGPPGVGKSRLLAALAADRIERDSTAAVELIAGEAFVAACASASESRHGWAELRARFRSLDLLLLDAVGDLERAPWALEELGHTFEAIDARGGALALTARRGPAHWASWPRRLAGQFGAGLSIQIDPPGPATRRRYLLARALARGLTLGPDEIEALVAAHDRFAGLDGALTRRELIARLGTEVVPEDEGATGLTLDRIAQAVAERFGVTARSLRGPSRSASVARARHLAIWLADQHSGASKGAIGRFFGNRDRATVRHAIAAARARVEADPALLAACLALGAGWPTPTR